LHKIELAERTRVPLHLGRPSCAIATVRYRRVLPIPLHPSEGLLTELTADAQPWPRELVFMPHLRPPHRSDGCLSVLDK